MKDVINFVLLLVLSMFAVWAYTEMRVAQNDVKHLESQMKSVSQAKRDKLWKDLDESVAGASRDYGWKKYTGEEK